MNNGVNLILSSAPMRHARLRAEICEHKGNGHPDSICDGVAEAVSQALCAAYLKAYGEIRHHNVDKALLIGGQSRPRFGGGTLDTRMRLIVAGRADPLPYAAVADLVIAAARNYLASTLRCSIDLFDIEPAIRTGSTNLRRVFTAIAQMPLANDTSFGVGFAPYSSLERTILHLAQLLRSTAFRAAFPAVGDDFKIMGARIDKRMIFTIALAFIDHEVDSIAHYFALKESITNSVATILPQPYEVHINALDDANASDENGIYLTVTGLSAEHGDDGQVGRGNRVSGLITPSRSMSLEAAAGKNPVSHVGKIYNVLAVAIANDLVAQIPEIDEATVQLLSEIGQPVNQPKLVSVQVARAGVPLTPFANRRLHEIVHTRLQTIGTISEQLIRGVQRVF